MSHLNNHSKEEEHTGNLDRSDSTQLLPGNGAVKFVNDVCANT